MSLSSQSPSCLLRSTWMFGWESLKVSQQGQGQEKTSIRSISYCERREILKSSFYHYWILDLTLKGKNHISSKKTSSSNLLLKYVLTKSLTLLNADKHDLRNLVILVGISREGWSITKNLATELIIVVGGFFTFVPAIQVCWVVDVFLIMSYLCIIFFDSTWKSSSITDL